MPALSIDGPRGEGCSVRRSAAALGLLLLGVLLLALLAALAFGCHFSANRPRWTLVPAARGAALEPRPPPRVFWLRVVRAQLPALTKVGTAWDDGDGPDPFFVLFAGRKELMRSEPEADQLEPTWSEGPRGNFALARSMAMRIDLFDSDALQEHPMGSAKFLAPSDRELADGEIELELDRGGKVWLAVEKAHAMMGLGFTFEVRRSKCFVVKSLEHSPVGRGGMRDGDRLLVIGGRKTRGLRAEQISSLLETVPSSGLELVVQHGRGSSTERLQVKQGPVYPLFKEYGRLD